MIKKIIAIIKKVLKKHNYVFYLGSTDMLPPPLSKEEETMYVEKSMNGDEEARNILIEHNLRLVVFLAKKYENTKIDLEDLVSIGTIGLIKGVNTYKLDKNIKLATYASRCIDNEILMYLRKTKRKKSEVSFEDSLSYDADGNEISVTREVPVIAEEAPAYEVVGIKAWTVAKYNDKIDWDKVNHETRALEDSDAVIVALVEDNNLRNVNRSKLYRVTFFYKLAINIHSINLLISIYKVIISNVCVTIVIFY